MSAVTSARYAAAARASFRSLLLRWLSDLPPGGWEGTAGELFHELATADRSGRAWIPAGGGLSRNVKDAEPALAAAGWAVSFTRTKAARTVRFRRAG